MSDKSIINRQSYNFRKKHYNWPKFFQLVGIWFFGLIWFFPVLWMFRTSIVPNYMSLQAKTEWIPSVVTFQNYIDAVIKAPLLLWFWNSLIIAVICTVMVLIVNAMAAYAFARLNFWGKNFLFALILSTMMIPQQVTLVPLFIFFNNMGLVDNYLAVILPRAGAAIGVFLLTQFFKGIPKDLEDAARIDGYSRYQIFWHIILPLSKPALAALTIFTFIWSWNDFLWPLITLLSREMYTLPLGLAIAVAYMQREFGLHMASSIIVSIPAFIIFLFFQRQFIQGISTTGLKG